MRKRIRNMNIKKKLVFYSYLIITPILMVISVVLFLKNYQSDIKEERELCRKTVEGLSVSIDTMLNGIAEFGTYFCINEDILKILTADDVESYNQDFRLWYNQAPMDIVQDMIALSGQVKTLAIYPENGVRPYLRCMDATAYLSTIEKVRSQEIYERVKAKRGKIIYRYVPKGSSDTYSACRVGKIVMYREIYDLSQKTPLGYLAIGASAQKYAQLCENALLSENAGIVVLNEYGEELLRAGTPDQEILDRIHAGEKLAETMNGYTIYSKKSTSTGITIYEMVSLTDSKERFWKLIADPAALLFAFLIGLYPILVIVSNIVSNPLKKLCKAMEAFEEGDFTQKVEVTTGDEVGEASVCFNQMVDAIRELIDTNYVMALKEKESELNALQAQINPHFLYNTLDSLYWQAMNEGNEEIAENILTLSNLFRHVLGQGTGMISVENEKALLEEYLCIQKMRFENLTYKVEMSEEVLSRQIPKLILQPFVENAVVHGFERVGDSCFVLISGEHDGKWLTFQVRDNGVGMNEEQVRMIWDVPDTKRYSGQRIGRYAIKNVKERLELKYHSDFVLEIESKEGEGTCVIIKIPWEEA